VAQKDYFFYTGHKNVFFHDTLYIHIEYLDANPHVLKKLHFEICLPQWDQAKVDFHIDDLTISTIN
jgi:hypothetical protein